MSNKLINQKKITGGIISTPGNNTNLWYTRESFDKISVNGSFSGLETPFDWVLIKDIDSKYIKAGTINVSDGRKSVTIQFNSIFLDSNYSVFFLSSKNIHLYWSDKKREKFTLKSSSNISGEVSWIAIHKNANTLYGSKGILSGERALTYDSAKWAGDMFIEGNSIFDSPSLSMPVIVNDVVNDEVSDNPLNTIPPRCCINLNGWFNNEYIIKPSYYRDGIKDSELLLNDFSTGWSIIISSDVNINMFWIAKGKDRIKIGTSYPKRCIISYMIIKSGLNWWDTI